MQVLFDLEQNKIGCVLLQASCSGSVKAAKQFHTDFWFLTPTNSMRLYETSQEQLDFIKEKFKNK